jgi:hypothetical protein
VADQVFYAIRVRGVLDPAWSSWFGGREIHSEVSGESVIVGPVVDQAALHGVLTKVRDLGLPLISVCVIEGGGVPGGPDP